VGERRGYYTDTTDEQWALMEPVIAAWKAAHPSVSGHTPALRDARDRRRADLPEPDRVPA
jgi:hypothetical protein